MLWANVIRSTGENLVFVKFTQPGYTVGHTFSLGDLCVVACQPPTGPPRYAQVRTFFEVKRAVGNRWRDEMADDLAKVCNRQSVARSLEKRQTTGQRWYFSPRAKHSTLIYHFVAWNSQPQVSPTPTRKGPLRKHMARCNIDRSRPRSCKRPMTG